MDPVKHHGQEGVETVVREFPPVGRYRIRLLRDKEGKLCLDVREYRTAQRFEGFTRRGVRLYDAVQVELFLDVLREVFSAWKERL